MRDIDIDADDHGARFLSRRLWTGQRLIRLQTTSAVELVALRTGEELGAIGQDTWLTTCGAEDYPQTRAWAHWLRTITRERAGTRLVLQAQPCSDRAHPLLGPLPAAPAYGGVRPVGARRGVRP
jgi:hypothetical protein